MSASVEQVTQSLADTTIQPADEGAHSISATEGRRLYIGNLAYSTTEAELKEFFKSYKVESVSIPVNPRTSRAVGYAFVDVSTKEEAEKAIDELSGKEVLERRVSVQLARRPNANQGGASPEGGNGERGGRRGGRGGRGGSRGGRGGRDGPSSRGGKPRAPRKDSEGSPKEGEAPAAAAPETSGQATSGDDKENAGGRPKKKKGPPENGVPSTTKVMVANLPYELSEDKLKEIFSAYEPESAKIALRPIPRFMVRKLQARGEARKGRGFGFVTLSSEEMQKKAVEEMNGKIIEGREIAVKVAIDNPKMEGEEGDESHEEGANGTKETPAATEAATPAAAT